MSLGDDLQWLDWTGRQLAQGKKGRIPDAIEPILQRLQLDQNGYLKFVLCPRLCQGLPQRTLIF